MNLLLRAIVYLIILMLGTSTVLYAGVEPYENFIKGKVNKGDTLVVKDEKFKNPSYNWSDITNTSVNNTITLRLLDEIPVNENFTCNLELKVEYFKTPGQTSPDIINNVKLSVSHSTAKGATYKLTDSYAFTNGYWVKVTVTNIFSPEIGYNLPAYFQLSSQIVINRQYKFDPSAKIKPNVQLTQSGTNNVASGMRLFGVDPANVSTNYQLELNWPAISGAEEYDIEWTTLDAMNDFSATVTKMRNAQAVTDQEANEIFRNNASRITTEGQTYKLSLIYDNAFVLVRMRQVHYTDGIRLEGDWDYKLNDGVSYAIWDLTWHQSNLNWQYSVAFAEEGKKKEVVSYFDGTLRNRQTVTINNSDMVPVVQENIYDEFGRPSASILPAPFKEANPYLRYIKNFNKNGSGKAYSAADLNSAACEISPALLQNSSGASKYYSSANDFKNDRNFNQYIPDASGYPLSATQYTPDNTGRIKTQGGVGQAFQPGIQPNHTTRYFYGKPDQWELNQLFGNDVGYAEHYQKNTVIDANGQVSLSYLNASGKTIATALTGNSPDNVDSLPGTGNAVLQDIKLLKPEQIVFSNTDLKLTGTTTYISTVTGSATLTYDIDKLIHKYKIAKTGEDICSSCYYDLRISVKDDCGQSFLPGGADYITRTIGKIDPVCDPEASEPGQFTTSQLSIGAYYITFEFVMSRKVMEDFVDNYVNNNADLRKEGDFIFDYVKKIDFSACLSDCKTCLDILGTKADFTGMLSNKLNILGVSTTALGAEYTTWVDGKYTELQNYCNALVANCDYSPCLLSKQLMLTDVSPGGQYALFDKNGQPLEIQTNVLNTNNLHIAFPVKPSSDVDYQRELITLPDGSVTSPYDGNFTITQLLTYWKNEWAEKFLQFHPEYCKLQFCELNSVYKNWDEKIKNQTTNPAYNLNTTGETWLLSTDPFFASSGPGALYYDAMLTDLQQYSKTMIQQASLPVKSLLNVVLYNLYCADNQTLGTTTNTAASKDINSWLYCTPNTACRVIERELELYKTYYFELKEKYYKMRQDATTCANNSCANIIQPVKPPALNGCATPIDFTFDVVSGVSCGSSAQNVSIKYVHGKLKYQTKLWLYYPPEINSSGLPASIVLGPGESSYLLCLPSNISVNSLKISAVNCTNEYVENTDPLYCFTFTYGADRPNYNAEGSKIQLSVSSPLQDLPRNAVWGGTTSQTALVAKGSTSDSTATSLSTMSLGVSACDAGGRQCAEDRPQPSNNPGWPLNRAGIWSKTNFEANYDELLGFQKTFYAPESKTYYIGFASDNKIDIWIDDQQVVNKTDLGNQYTYWTVVSVTISKGMHTLRAEMINVCGTGANPASVGIEIYNNTYTQLVSATNFSDLNLIFSTSSLRGVDDVQSFRTKPDGSRVWHYERKTDINNYPAPAPVGNCPVALITKVSRFGAGTSTGSSANVNSSTITPEYDQQTQAQIEADKNMTIESEGDTWLENLAPGLQDANGNYIYSQQWRDELKAQLINIVKAGGGYDQMGAAIKAKMNLAAYTPLVNPYLFDYPSLNGSLNQVAFKTVSRTSPAICDKLAALKQQFPVRANLINYLKISPEDLDALEDACGNCRYLLKVDVKLPVALDPDAPACINWTAYTNAKASLLAEFQSLSSSSDNYNVILANYMNQKFGFVLGFSQYESFEENHNDVLCNTPPYGGDDNYDKFDCIKIALANAVSNGKRDYAFYIEEQKSLFRQAYINTCSAAKAYVNMSASQRIYHYTLYYYDQADNLVRTVPPAGVKVLNNSQIKWVDEARGYDASVCNDETVNCNGTTITYSTNTTDAFNGLSSVLSSTAARAIEFWFYNSNYNQTNNMIRVTPDRKYMLQVVVNGADMGIDIYSITQSADGASVVLNPNSKHYRVSLTEELPLHPWIHLVIQSQNFGNGTLPQIYVNGNLRPVSTVPTPLAAGWNLTIDANAVTYPDDIQTLKHLRLYTRLLTSAEISLNAKNNCLKPTNGCNMSWYRFNIPAPGSETTIASTSTIERRNSPVYPDHILKTSYTYNATNQIIQQLSPDAGISMYWYDMLGRLVASQNAKQENSNKFSYTKYDALGRITEVGEKQTTYDIGSPAYLTDDKVAGFLASGANAQITQTWYDMPAPATSTNGVLTNIAQQNLRKRVAASLYFDTPDAAASSGMYYDYDLSGNVKTFYRQIPGLGTKKVNYEYDLISGKVNFVAYQPQAADQFYYAYKYDAENRLTEAWSSPLASLSAYGRGSVLDFSRRRMDAAYNYYLHGPLARAELGDINNKVQGIDYAYTLQGWLKGVNGNVLNPAQDIGADAAVSGKDVLAYTLNYYPGDYTPIGTNNAFTMNYQSAVTDATGQGLYNGNISGTTLALSALNNGNPVGYTYRYDQLNRLKQTRQHTLNPATTLWDATSAIEAFKETVQYDGNGNILRYTRNGAGSNGLPLTMDNLTYSYPQNSNGLTSNKLNYIADAVPAGNYSNDIDNQSGSNYTYDPIGNLRTDTKAGITNISWTVYGKIQNLTNASGTINYKYDAAGNRQSKTVGGITTWYVRDAQGNALALYDNQGATTNWREQGLYGSSRLGMWRPDMDIATGNALTIWDLAGRKQFELSNHLGNVLATISDKRTLNNNEYEADVLTAQDYYPFGMLQPGRNYTADGTGAYRYGFNGKENDNDVGKGEGNQQDYGMRIYDPRIAKFLSVDPLSPKFPDLSTYQFASNSPIANIDLDGEENLYFQITHDAKTGKATIKKETEHFPLEKIMPYNVYFNIDNSGYFYQGSYVLSFEGQRKMLNQTISNYAKNPKEAIQYLKDSKFAADKRNQEDRDFWQNIWVDGYTTAWAVNRTNQPTSTKSPIVAPESNPVERITLKNNTPQIGDQFKSLGINISGGKININGRSVTNGTFDFVIKNNGGLKIGTGHYNLSEGAESVQAAGQLKIYKGQVTTITNSSGHYQPNINQGEAAAGLLQKAGVNVQGANIKLYNVNGVLEKSYKLQ